MSLSRKLAINTLDKCNLNMWARLHTGQRLLVDMSNTVGRSIFLHKKYESEIEALMRALLQSADDFLDVGANVGYFSVVASQTMVTQGRVVALEPNLTLCNLIQKSIRRNRIENLSIIPVGVGLGLRIETFQVQRSSGISFVGTSEHVLDGDQVIETRTILVETIDNILGSFPDPVVPKLAKIDVEGREIEVLHGAVNLLIKGDTYFIIEHSADNQARFGYSTNCIANFLKQYGYTARNIDGSLNVDWKRADVLWSPP